MPMFAVLLADVTTGADEIRRKYMAAHLQFLQRHADTIQAAGPLREPNGTAAGGMWVVNAVDAPFVQALTFEDPFWAAGLRRSIRVLEWAQVFADGATLV